MIVNVLGGEKHFKCRRAFVVEALEVGAETGGDKAGMEDFECTENALAGTIAHRLHEDAVAVVIVEDQDIIVSGTRCDNKAASLIGMNLPGGWFTDGSKTVMGAVVFGFAGWKI